MRGHLLASFCGLLAALLATSACVTVVRRDPFWKRYEYGGCIFTDGTVFQASLPVSLDPKSPTYCLPPPAPAGMRLVADYHNHTESENFSTDDKTSRPRVAHYLLTPQEVVKRYTPDDGVTVTLR